MTVTADTIKSITQSEYTIGTSGTITTADFALFLQWATDQFLVDNPGNATDSISDLAVGLLVCHYIDRSKNSQNIKSENAGDGSVTFDDSGSNWKKSYEDLISKLEQQLTRQSSGPSVTSQPYRGVTRKDAGTSYPGAIPSSQG